MIPANDDLLILLKAVYEQTDGNLNTSVNVPEIGEELGWDRKKTSAVHERLMDRDLIQAFAWGGNISGLTLDGL